jgi:hypothetical protein
MGYGAWSISLSLVDLYAAILTYTSLRSVSGSPLCSPLLSPKEIFHEILPESGPNVIFFGLSVPEKTF